jgi:hypothetical protein
MAWQRPGEATELLYLAFFDSFKLTQIPHLPPFLHHSQDVQLLQAVQGV